MTSCSRMSGSRWVITPLWLSRLLKNFLYNTSVYSCHFLIYSASVQSVQSLSCVWLFVTLWTAAHQASLSITISQSLFKLVSMELVMPSNHLILCCPLLLLPSIFPSIRVFSNESVFASGGQSIGASALASVLPSVLPSIIHSNEYSWLFSFRIDWFDLLAVQGTLLAVQGIMLLLGPYHFCHLLCPCLHEIFSWQL